MACNTFQKEVSRPPGLGWVKLVKYCELSGETKQAVYGKRKHGIWLEGIQCKIAPDGKLWINLKEVELWVQHGNTPARSKLQRAYKRDIPSTPRA